MSTEVIVLAFDHKTDQFIAKGTRWSKLNTWEHALSVASRSTLGMAREMPNGCIGIRKDKALTCTESWLRFGFDVKWHGAFNAPEVRAIWPLESITLAVSSHLELLRLP